MTPHNPYPTPLDQAWLRWWVERYGPDSKLAQYLLPEALYEHRPIPQFAGKNAAPDQKRKQFGRNARASEVEKAPPQRARKSGIGHNRPSRRDRQIDGEVRRMNPLSDWARRLIGDKRNEGITLDDVIDGIEDYFVTFERLRKVDKHAFAYFRRVGAPLGLRNHAIWEAHIDAPIPNGGTTLPSYCGAFFPSTTQEYREQIVNDEPSLGEFAYFTKVKNPVTVAPLGTTIFQQSMISLGRDGFSKEERKRFPWATANFGMWWYVGVLPDGSVKALPCRMEHRQRLPRGGLVHTSRFEIPEGLRGHKDHEGQILDAHRWAQRCFSAILAFMASAMSGVHVTIRKNQRSARVGVPIGAVKAFFADRDLRDGQERRKPILHLRLSHDRVLHNGQIVTVGEHLSGERQFEWRGYEISIGVPGIHHPLPEAFRSGVYFDDPEAEWLPNEKLFPITDLAKEVQKIVWRGKRVRFRSGEPEKKYAHSLVDDRPEPPELIEPRD